VSSTRASSKFDFGAAYVLRLGSGGWEQAIRLAASDASGAHDFGRHVSIDGNHALIGAAGYNDDAGAAYVFRLGTDGWKQVLKLTAGDAAAGGAFGSSVAVDRVHALVGATGDTVGAAYPFLT
jgi:hypothetical protein